jgi:hypothetical protein
MDSLKPLGGLVTAGLVVAILVVAVTTATGAGAPDQLLGSDYQVAALVTALVFAGALGTYAAIGRPWKRWDRTPYW